MGRISEPTGSYDDHGEAQKSSCKRASNSAQVSSSAESEQEPLESLRLGHPNYGGGGDSSVNLIRTSSTDAAMRGRILLKVHEKSSASPFPGAESTVIYILSKLRK